MALEGARLRVDTSDQGIHQDALPMMITMRQDGNRFRNRATDLGGQNANPPQPPHTVPPIVVDLTTIFGQADVGGVTIDLSVNALFSMIQDLKAKQDVLMDRSSNTGIMFNNQAFASELEFTRYYLAANGSGKGLAAFVDLVSI